jgi:hypothetical protein
MHRSERFLLLGATLIAINWASTIVLTDLPADFLTFYGVTRARPCWPPFWCSRAYRLSPVSIRESDYQMISFLVTSMMQAYYFVFKLYRALPLPVKELQQLATGDLLTGVMQPPRDE